MFVFTNKKQVLFYTVGAGIGATIYDTKINALNGSTPYNFASISGSGYSNRKYIREQLKSMMDNSYETDAENNTKNTAKLGGNTLKPSGSVLAGIAFKLSKSINLALEDKFTFIKDDLLRWPAMAGASGS